MSSFYNVPLYVILSVFFFFNDTATTEIYTLSLHDALPIWLQRRQPQPVLRYPAGLADLPADRKSTRLNSSHITISYAVFCLKKKKTKIPQKQNRNTHLATTQTVPHPTHR